MISPRDLNLAPPQNEQEIAVCTIISKNYLAYARVLARSVHRFHPGVKFFVLIVDRIEDCFDRTREPFEVVLAD